MLANQISKPFGLNLSTREEPLNCHEHQTRFTRRALTRWHAILRFVFGLCLSRGSEASGGNGCGG